MKKFILGSLYFMTALATAQAQWINTGFNYTTDRVAIGTNNAYGKRLMVTGNDVDHIAYFKNTNVAGFGMILSAHNDPLRIVSPTNDSDHLLVIKGNGSLGIGTTNPLGALEVAARGPQAWAYFNGNIEGWNNPLTNSGMALGWNRSGGAGESIIAYQNSTGGYPRLDFASFSGSSFTTEMTLVQGRLGIGTNSPDAKLTVKGDIHTREVRVDLVGAVAPDFVFEKDYNLLPLAELEAYINKYKHLPEIPSAKEMEANGLNLKEMNLLLLKKVEELTLHLIEQQKQIAEQQKDITEIRDENNLLKEKITGLSSLSR